MFATEGVGGEGRLGEPQCLHFNGLLAVSFGHIRISQFCSKIRPHYEQPVQSLQVFL
jgi:hypothetical protein